MSNYNKIIEILEKHVDSKEVFYGEIANEILDLLPVSDSFTWSEMEEFGRNAFYKGREVKRYNDRGDAIFKRPTYNGYLREIGDG